MNLLPPPPPVHLRIQIDNVLPGNSATSGGGGHVRQSGLCTATIEGDADGVFSVAAVETLALMHDPELPPKLGQTWEIVDRVDGAGPIDVGSLDILSIRVRFACPAFPAKDTYTATAIAVFEDSQQLALHVPITANVMAQQLEISLLQGPSTFNRGQTQEFVFSLNSTFRVNIVGAFGLEDSSNTPFIEVTPMRNFPAIPALGSITATVSVRCGAAAGAGDYELTFSYFQLSGPAPSQTITASVQVLVPAPQPPDPHKDHVNAVWVAGSTQRICQLTGSGDPQGLPHPNDTTRFSLLGTDLGSSFDHFVNGEHRTYFFFGDTSTHDGDSTGDAIAYTTDDKLDPEGLHLQFIMGNEQWRRLIIPGVSLEAFEVPSGGFSYGGRIYVFATTGHVKIGNSDYMESSVLASATDAHNNFDLAYYVSRRDDAVDAPDTGGKFINVSPVVINNDDWPGLPDNASPGGQGLLMAGSGRYRESAPYLAYARLSDGGGPARSDWRYLQGFGFWEPGYGPNGPPSWSDCECDASPMFPAEIGEISYSFHAGLGRWLIVYAGYTVEGSGIVLRSAPMPWGPWSEPQLIFDAKREGALGFYMFECGPYGAYVIPRYNRWNPAAQEATFYYTLSNGCCSDNCSEPRYQVHLMKSTLRLL